jgi:hypothetical protein
MRVTMDRFLKKMYKVTNVFHLLIQKFSDSYIPEDQLSIDDSLLL